MWEVRACLAVACAAVLGGCYGEPNACGITCDTTCPGDFQCVNHVCVPATGVGCEAPPLELLAIDTGCAHTCGLTPDGTISCWGDNSQGQLGTPGIKSSGRPVQVSDPSVWTALTVGSEHACALRDGLPWCWGQNRDGQSSPGQTGLVNAPAPVLFGPVQHPATFDQISAGGDATCMIGSGELWCWGNHGATASGGMTVTKPTRVGMAGDWRQVSMGWDHGCAIGDGAGLVCWGGNRSGQVAQPTTTMQVDDPMAVTFPDGSRAVAVSAGDELTCAITTLSSATTPPGELWCWGNNGNLQIDDTRQSIASPVQMGSGAGWTEVSAGAAAICGVLSGQTYCWGLDYGGGMFGTGLWNLYEVAFMDSTALPAADKLSLSIGQQLSGLGLRFACGITGTVGSCWGDNATGALGLGIESTHDKPFEVAAPSNSTWAHVWGGDGHVCATTTAGALWCWGQDERGQVTATVGLGEAQPCVAGMPCDQPHPIAAPVASADEVMAGRAHSCARTGTTIQCWGDPSGDKLGLSNTSSHAVIAVDPPPGQTWTKLTGGWDATCGITDVGAVSCWGQVGTSQRTPMVLTNVEIHDIASVGMGDLWVCATRTVDASRVCWGRNQEHELGNDATGDLTSTAAVVLDAGDVASVAVGNRHGCYVTLAGGVKCWGSNYSGESGQPTATYEVPHPTVINAAAGGVLGGCSALSLGQSHSCALCSGVVQCWGTNTDGELGRGTRGNSKITAAPVLTEDGQVFVELAARGYGTCALDNRGKLWCWGWGAHGDNGDGGQDRNLPTPVTR